MDVRDFGMNQQSNVRWDHCGTRLDRIEEILGVLGFLRKGKPTTESTIASFFFQLSPQKRVQFIIFDSCEGNLKQKCIPDKMQQTQGHLNEGMSSRQRFLTPVSAVRSESDLFQMESKKKRKKITDFNISCLCYYRIPPSPSFPMSASSLLPSLS